MKEIYAQNAIRHKPWKKAVCALLSFIIAFGAAVTMLFGNVLLSDYVDFGNLITANAAESDLRPVPVFYLHGELVGLYRVNYTDKTELQYKIGEEGEWTAYKVLFTIPAHKTTKVYARIGDDGKIIPQHITPNSNWWYADNIEYVWSNKGWTKLKYRGNGNPRTRLNDTRQATIAYLIEFIDSIGGKSKVK